MAFKKWENLLVFKGDDGKCHMILMRSSFCVYLKKIKLDMLMLKILKIVAKLTFNLY